MSANQGDYCKRRKRRPRCLRASARMDHKLLPETKVDQVYGRLGPDDLISAEASLLSFLLSADEQPRRQYRQGRARAVSRPSDGIVGALTPPWHTVRRC